MPAPPPRPAGGDQQIAEVLPDRRIGAIVAQGGPEFLLGGRVAGQLEQCPSETVQIGGVVRLQRQRPLDVRQGISETRPLSASMYPR